VGSERKRVEEERGKWEVRGRVGEGRNHWDDPHKCSFAT
jgi:hypothetical protein